MVGWRFLHCLGGATDYSTAVPHLAAGVPSARANRLNGYLLPRKQRMKGSLTAVVQHRGHVRQEDITLPLSPGLVMAKSFEMADSWKEKKYTATSQKLSLAIKRLLVSAIRPIVNCKYLHDISKFELWLICANQLVKHYFVCLKWWVTGI